MKSAARRIYNPVQQDAVTFVHTAAETGGERTVLELEVVPGGANEPHYHSGLSEQFAVLEGQLEVLMGREWIVLAPGDTATAPPNTRHGFRNRTRTPARVLVEFRPGHTGFEQALRIAYGLAIDGEVSASGIPRGLRTLGVLMRMSDTQPAGVARLFAPVLSWYAGRLRGRAKQAELLARYCTPLPPPAASTIAVPRVRPSRDDGEANS
jgi:quercetin dioxygenase-like cupin family protein